MGKLQEQIENLIEVYIEEIIEVYIEEMRKEFPQPVKPEDLEVEKHQGGRRAFLLIYQWGEERGFFNL